MCVEGCRFTHHQFFYSSARPDLASLQKRQFLIYLLYIYIDPSSGLTSGGKVGAPDEKQRTASLRAQSCSSLIGPQTPWKMQNRPPLFSHYSVFSKNYAKICCLGEFDVEIFWSFPHSLWFTLDFGLSAGIHVFSSSIYPSCFLGTDHPFSSAKQASSLALFSAERLQQHEEDATVTSGTRTSGLSL